MHGGTLYGFLPLYVPLSCTVWCCGGRRRPWNNRCTVGTLYDFVLYMYVGCTLEVAGGGLIETCPTYVYQQAQHACTFIAWGSLPQSCVPTSIRCVSPCHREKFAQNVKRVMGGIRNIVSRLRRWSLFPKGYTQEVRFGSFSPFSLLSQSGRPLFVAFYFIIFQQLSSLSCWVNVLLKFWSCDGAVVKEYPGQPSVKVNRLPGWGGV